MALVFRWYLGLSSAWANRANPAGSWTTRYGAAPATGAFNLWVKGTRLESWENRRVADVAQQLMQGAAYLSRLQYLGMHGVQVSAELRRVSVKS